MIDKNLWQETKKSKPYLVGTILSGFLCGGLIVSQAYFLALLVDEVFLKGQDLKGTLPFFVFLAGIITLRGILGWLEEWFALQLAHRVQRSLREEIVLKIEKLGPVSLREEQTGELMNLVTEGIEVLHAYFGKYLPQLIKTALIPVLFLLIIFPRDWPTGLILLCTAPLLPVFMILIGKWSQSVTKKQWWVLSRMTGYFQDVIQGLTTLKMLNRSQEQGTKIEEISEDFRKTSLNVLRIAFLSALTMELFSTLSIALVAVGLGVRLVEGQILFSTAFFLLLLAPEFYQPIRSLGTQYHASLNGVAAAERIYSFLNQPEALPARQSQAEIIQEEELQIEFCQVSYTYQNQKNSTSKDFTLKESLQRNPALKNISFTIRKGEKVALVGSSGGGKTTILHLLLGFITPTEGRILLNGKDMEEVNLDSWRDLLAWVPQKPYLFAGTIRENLLLGNSRATESQMLEACTLLGVHDFVKKMPEGYETLIGEGGRSLSGGQRQLLAITRAWLKKTPLLLLDEATANLDLVREEAVQLALQELMKEKTVFVAAHRLQIITQMDQILVVEQGQLVESGSPAALLAEGGRYFSLLEAGGKAHG